MTHSRNDETRFIRWNAFHVCICTVSNDETRSRLVIKYLTKYPQMWYNKYRKRKYNSYQLGR